MAPEKSIPQDPELLNKEAEAMDLRVNQGKTWQQIADALGYAGPSGAYQAVQRALGRYPATKTDEYRQLQNAQLDKLEGATLEIFQQAVNEGDLELALKAQDRFQKWMDRRSKLNGVDAPVKSEVEHKGGSFAVQVPVSRLPEKAARVLNAQADEDGE